MSDPAPPIDARRRSRRIAGRPAVPVAAPAAFSRRRQPRLPAGGSVATQSHSPLPASEFNFTVPEPAVPEPGFSNTSDKSNVKPPIITAPSHAADPPSSITTATANRRSQGSLRRNISVDMSWPDLRPIDLMDIDSEPHLAKDDVFTQMPQSVPLLHTPEHLEDLVDLAQSEGGPPRLLPLRSSDGVEYLVERAHAHGDIPSRLPLQPIEHDSTTTPLQSVPLLHTPEHVDDLVKLAQSEVGPSPLLPQHSSESMEYLVERAHANGIITLPPHLQQTPWLHTPQHVAKSISMAHSGGGPPSLLAQSSSDLRSMSGMSGPSLEDIEPGNTLQSHIPAPHIRRHTRSPRPGPLDLHLSRVERRQRIPEMRGGMQAPNSSSLPTTHGLDLITALPGSSRPDLRHEAAEHPPSTAPTISARSETVDFPLGLPPVVDASPTSLAVVTTSRSTVTTGDVALQALAPKSQVASVKCCNICGDSAETVGSPLLKPCRKCKSDYCAGCVREMFFAASVDMSRMPARCCVMVQLHVGLPLLSKKEAADYRTKFEEWMTIDKVYCPKSACSAFIPERLSEQPHITQPQFRDTFLQELPRIVHELRMYNDLHLPRKLQDTGTVKRPLDFSVILTKLLKYSMMTEFMDDFNLMVDQLPLCDPAHVVAAQNLRHHLFKLLDGIPIRLSPQIAQSQAPVLLLACPDCATAICAKCKQVAHQGKPCDTTAQDYEMALLATYNYKRCPKCKTAVKRMYGCNHMACVCGAHWCYHCQRSFNECDGACDQEPGSNEEDYDDDELDEAEGESDVGSQSNRPQTTATDSTVTAPSPATTNMTPGAPVRNRTANLEAPLRPARDLDAGGAREWADGVQNFGDEPSDNVQDVWSCLHTLSKVRKEYLEGLSDHTPAMECNRCFAKVKIWGSRLGVKTDRSIARTASDVVGTETDMHSGVSGSGVQAAPQSESVQEQERKRHRVIRKPTSRLHGTPLLSVGETAWECQYCNLLVCGDCKPRFVSD